MDKIHDTTVSAQFAIALNAISVFEASQSLTPELKERLLDILRDCEAELRMALARDRADRESQQAKLFEDGGSMPLG